MLNVIKMIEHNKKPNKIQTCSKKSVILFGLKSSVLADMTAYNKIINNKNMFQMRIIGKAGSYKSQLSIHYLEVNIFCLFYQRS
jgi:hypothetical protein